MPIDLTDPSFRATDLQDLDTKITALYALVLSMPGVDDIPETRARGILEKELPDVPQGNSVSPEVARAMYFIQFAIKKARQERGYA